MSTELTKVTNVNELLNSEDFSHQVGLALPKEYDCHRFAAMAQSLLTKVPKLANCELMSMQKAFLDCATLGLYPNGSDVHILPYGKTAQVIVDYKGLIKLMLRSGKIKKVYAETVHDNDKFTYRNGEVDHEIDFRNPRGEMYAVYCAVVMNDGDIRYEVMSKEEVEKVKKSSKSSSNGPWLSWFESMSKKTVIRRASKFLDLSSDNNMDLQLKLAELDALEHQKVDLSSQPHINEDKEKVYRELKEEMDSRDITIEKLAEMLNSRLGFTLTDISQLDETQAQRTLTWILSK